MVDKQEKPTRVLPHAEELEPQAEERSAPAEETANEAVEKMAESVEASTQVPEEKPMIEPHAAQHPVTTWKDFFVHIAVVTIGLLLAIALEQTVEYYHHRHLVEEARKALAVERKINVARFQMESKEMRRFVPMLKTNLAIYQYLREHPGAPPEKWPGQLHLYSYNLHYSDAEWRTAQSSNVLQYMPQHEVRDLSSIYNSLNRLNEIQIRKVDEKRESFRFFIQNPDAQKFTPEQLDRAIDYTTETILLYAVEANLMSNLNHGYEDFTGGPTTEDYNAILQFAPSPEDKKMVMDESGQEIKLENEISRGSEESAPEDGK
jgi:hypothetical protein